MRRRASWIILWGVVVALLAPAPASAQGGRRWIALPDVSVTAAATLIRAADSTRVALVCTNTDAAVHVRDGGLTVTASRGAQLRAGASITMTTRAAVYMFSEGAAVTVACSEELQ